MNTNSKAVAISGVTALSSSGIVATIDYIWQFTSLPALPPETMVMLATLIAGVIYRILPESQRTGNEKPK